MPIKGNVVRFGGEKELYVVMSADSSGHYPNVKLNKIQLIPFDHCNSSTHISREHPLKKRVKTEELCKIDECDHFDGECPWDYIPCDIYNVDNIEYIAETVNDFIMKKLKKLIYD